MTRLEKIHNLIDNYFETTEDFDSVWFDLNMREDDSVEQEYLELKTQVDRTNYKIIKQMKKYLKEQEGC